MSLIGFSPPFVPSKLLGVDSPFGILVSPGLKMSFSASISSMVSSEFRFFLVPIIIQCKNGYLIEYGDIITPKL